MYPLPLSIMEQKEPQENNELFMEYKGKGYNGWTLPKEVNEAELREVIHRIYDEKLSEELIAPKFRYKLFEMLMPDCPKKAIESARKNHSSKKPDNIQYHMQKLIPQLFVAAIHYSDYDRVSRSDIKIDEPLPKRQRLLYQNRLEKIIAFHLERKEELRDEIENLESGKGYMLEDDHYDEIKELKKKHREELEEEVYQLAKKKEKEKFDLEKENCHLKHQLKKLEFEMQCLATTSPNQPNQPNQSCDSKEDETDDVY